MNEQIDLAEEISSFIEVLALKVRVTGQKMDSGISFSELQVIAYLYKYGSSRMSQIAKSLSLKLTNVTGISDKLESKGVLVRKRSDEDRRAVYAELTPKGWTMAKENRAYKTELAQKMLSCLEPEEGENLFNLMRKITLHLQANQDSSKN